MMRKTPMQIAAGWDWQIDRGYDAEEAYDLPWELFNLMPNTGLVDSGPLWKTYGSEKAAVDALKEAIARQGEQRL